MLNQQKKSQRNFKLTPLSIAICAAVLSPTALFAQDQTETAQETEDNILEIIEVSARKKVESIQDIPMSVTAVPAKLIRDMGLNDLKEISKYVPGLERPNSVLQSRMAIRGVSSGDNWSFEQAVGTYVDGVYRGRMNQLRAGFFDMERIEVLKGPQVTLYGNSSIGGAISMISKAPTNALEGEINLRYETQYQETDFTGALNVPITDDFAIRLAGKIRKDGKGLSINQATGEDEPKSDDSAFRISSRWNINDNWTANLKMEQSTTRVDGNFLDVFKHVNGDGTPFEPSPYTGVGDNELNVTNGDFFKPDGTFWENKSNDVSLQIDYTNDAFSFVSITAMSEYDYTQSADIDVTPLPIANTFNNEAYEQFSQEFRIANELNESTDYILGVYYQNDEIDHDYYADFNVPLILAASTGLPLGTLSNLISPFSRHLSLVQDTSQWAIFANIDHEFSDHWEGSFGLRYLNMDKTADQAVNLQHNLSQFRFDLH
jgi:outer membrane receptor protein involved in Fe transport